jgi:hypothetical protein
MRISNDVFIPSQVLNDLYDILDDYVLVAGNEDIYEKDIVTEIPKFFDEHSKVNQFAYSTRAVDYSTEMLIVSWIEKYQLRHEVFLYDNGNRMYNED